MNEKAPAPAAGRRRFLQRIGATAGVVLSHGLLAAPKAMGKRSFERACSERSSLGTQSFFAGPCAISTADWAIQTLDPGPFPAAR